MFWENIGYRISSQTELETFQNRERLYKNYADLL